MYINNLNLNVYKAFETGTGVYNYYGMEKVEEEEQYNIIKIQVCRKIIVQWSEVKKNNNK